MGEKPGRGGHPEPEGERRSQGAGGPGDSGHGPCPAGKSSPISYQRFLPGPHPRPTWLPPPSRSQGGPAPSKGPRVTTEKGRGSPVWPWAAGKGGLRAERCIWGWRGGPSRQGRGVDKKGSVPGSVCGCPGPRGGGQRGARVPRISGAQRRGPQGRGWGWVLKTRGECRQKSGHRPGGGPGSRPRRGAGGPAPSQRRGGHEEGRPWGNGDGWVGGRPWRQLPQNAAAPQARGGPRPLDTRPLEPARAAGSQGSGEGTRRRWQGL